MINEEDYKPISKKRLIINGESKDYPTYKIPIDLLYYNYSNGRIETSIEQYNATHDGERIENLLQTDRAKYNDIIGQYIIDSANDKGKSFKRTKDDIKEKTQQVAGVILTDGRIIDGNRRFTALRQLYNESGLDNDKFGFFECVILPTPEEGDERNWQAIKKLELYLQFNQDEKRDYDPIDKLAAFYHDTKSLTEQQYCDSSGMSSKEYKTMTQYVAVALDYLNWLGKDDNSFYLLKIDKLDGPMREIARAWTPTLTDLKKMKIRDYVYPYMTIVVSSSSKSGDQKNDKKNAGDRTKDVRTILDSILAENTLGKEYVNRIDSEETNALIEEAVQYKIEINENKNKNDVETNQNHQSVVKDAAVTLLRAYKDACFISDLEDSKKETIENLKKANDILSSVAFDSGAIKNATKTAEGRSDFDDVISTIKGNIDKIEKSANE